MSLRVVAGGLDDMRVVALLGVHVRSVRASTAPGSAHALDLSGLRAPDVAFWTGWLGDALAGCAALKRLSAVHGEVKSMHVAKTVRRQGVGSALLRHVVAQARQLRLRRLSWRPGPGISSGRRMRCMRGTGLCLVLRLAITLRMRTACFSRVRLMGRSKQAVLF